MYALLFCIVSHDMSCLIYSYLVLIHSIQQIHILSITAYMYMYAHCSTGPWPSSISSSTVYPTLMAREGFDRSSRSTTTWTSFTPLDYSEWALGWVEGWYSFLLNYFTLSYMSCMWVLWPTLCINISHRITRIFCGFLKPLQMDQISRNVYLLRSNYCILARTDRVSLPLLF